jgi:hypothetical protein
MTQTIRRLSLFLTAVFVATSLAAGQKAGKIETPQISCAGGTQVSRNVTVCGKGSGLPAGFSLQWMTCDALAANAGVWFDSEDPRLSKASFSGNAADSRYRLGSGECVTVNVGEFLFDNGASTNSTAALSCGTCYVFRAFGHATPTLNRSDFTPDLSCSTLACNGSTECTLTFPEWGASGPTCDPGADSVVYIAAAEWRLTDITLGSVTYTAGKAECILNTPADGNGLISLAHQLIAAKLNVEKNGAPPAAVTACIADADALIGSLIVPPLGGGFLDPTATSALTSCLQGYNEGAVGPGACAPPDPGEDQ